MRKHPAPRDLGLSRDLAIFFALSHGWTFFFYALAAAVPGTVWEPPGRRLFLVGGAGVLLAAVASTAARAGASGLADLLARCLDPRRAAVGWWLAAALFTPVATLVAVGLVAWVDHEAVPSAPVWPERSTAALLTTAGALLLLGPLPEEIGWRGVLLDRLLADLRPLAATAVVALAWWSWHLPLYALPGYFEPFAHPPDIWRQLLGIAAASVLMTWAYLNTRRAVSIAVVFHWSGNLTGELLAPSPTVDGAVLALTTVAALAVVALGFPRLAGTARGS